MEKSYQLLACTYIRTQLEALAVQTDGARKAEDIEFIHQARVASRRLRAALRMFSDCFPGKKLKQWRKEIRRVTKDLGSARDKDVQIEFLTKVVTGLSDKERTCHPGIKRLLLRLRQQRDAVQKDVIKALDRLEARAVLPDIHAETGRILFHLQRSHTTMQSRFVFQQARDHIKQRLDQLLSREPCLQDSEDKQGHHQMRIDTKRLRYTMEICSLAFDGGLDETIKVAKKLQTVLGELHDCDVWIGNIEAFIDRERQRTIDYFGHARPFRRLEPGLQHLIAQKETDRRKLFSKACSTWEKAKADAVWENLMTVLQSHVAQYDKAADDSPTIAEKPPDAVQNDTDSPDK